MEAGQRAAVLCQAGQAWQVRVIICSCPPGDYTEVVGDPVPPALVTKCFNCLTPDGDIYPHLLSAGPLAGVVALDTMGERVDATSEGQKLRRRHQVYGADWGPTPLDYVAGLQFCRPEVLSSRAPTWRLCGKQVLTVESPPSRAGAAKAPSSLEVADGALPKPPDGHCWEVIATTGSGAVRTEFAGGAADGYAVAGGLGLVTMGTHAHVLRVVRRDELGGEGSLDARVFSIRVNSYGERRQIFMDAVNFIGETEWPFWFGLGPRTTRWYLRFLADQDAHPRSRHAKWKHETDLSSSDPSVAEHEFCICVFE
ncbi:unnamed protein product, partial [Prorocentrum cordatum]